jgi:hypothetical protein
MIFPPTIEDKNYDNLEGALKYAGYAMADMKPITASTTGIPIIVVRGIDGVIEEQPDRGTIERIGERFGGYTVLYHEIIGNAWETVFISSTGN